MQSSCNIPSRILVVDGIELKKGYTRISKYIGGEWSRIEKRDIRVHLISIHYDVAL